MDQQNVIIIRVVCAVPQPISLFDVQLERTQQKKTGINIPSRFLQPPHDHFPTKSALAQTSHVPRGEVPDRTETF